MSPRTRMPFLGELAAQAGRRRPRVLAWGQGDDAVVACLPDRLACCSAGQWAFTRWEDVDRGGWDQATGVLRWSGQDAVAHEAVLAQPRDLPEVFRDLVTASVVVQQNVAWDGGSAVISLRRNPSGDGSPVQWRVTPAADSDVTTPQAERALAQARAEWDIG